MALPQIRPSEDDARPPAKIATRPSQLLLGLGAEPPRVRLLSDELGSRPLRHRRLELEPDQADRIMLWIALVLSFVLVAGIVAGVL